MSVLAAKQASFAKLRVVNGRTVSASIADADVKEVVQADVDRKRESKEKLLRYYIQQGVLTRDGKLTPKYGG